VGVVIGCRATLGTVSEAGAGAILAERVATGEEPREIAVADLDGDSVSDLVTGGGTVGVLLGGSHRSRRWAPEASAF